MLAAGEAVAGVTAAGVVPVTLELMDAYTIAAVDDAFQLGLDRTAAAMLMIESDAGGAAAEAELATAEKACEAAGATSVLRARDAQEADWLREARRQAHPALERAGVARMDDVGVPRDRIPEMLKAIERVSAAQGLKVGVFGHAGDGNLHPTYVVDRDDPTAEQRIDAARAEIYKEALKLGGTVTGEHGTGLTKKPYLRAAARRGRPGADQGDQAGARPAGHPEPRQGRLVRGPFSACWQQAAAARIGARPHTRRPARRRRRHLSARPCS